MSDGFEPADVPKGPTTIFAETGRLSADPGAKLVRLQLASGSIHRSLDKGSYQVVEFSTYSLTVNLNQALNGVTKDELDMTLAELRANIASPKASAKLRLDMKLELHRRFALPFACLVFALVGVPLGVQNQRSGKAAGFAVSIGIILLYYMVLAAGKSFGERGLLPAAAAIWTPNVIFAIFGLYLFKKTAAEERFFIFEKGTALLQWCRETFMRRRRTS